MSKPFSPSNSDDLMGLVECHCVKCAHEEYARDPEADGERCPILTDVILGVERIEVQDNKGALSCSQWKEWQGVHEPIEVPDPAQTKMFP